MTSSIGEPNDTDAGRYRGLYILAVACFPVLLAGFLALVVFTTGLVQGDDGIRHKSKFAQFNYPVPGDLVSDKFELNGKIKLVPPGETVYLVEMSEGRYWPKVHLGNSPISFKRSQDTKPGAGYKYSVVLLSVGGEGDQQIQAWFENGRTTGKYPGISNIEQSTPLVRIRVVHR